MTDPLSIASGIAGLVSLAGFAIGQCYRYGCGVSNAPEESKRLVSEVTGLSGVLVGIQGIVKSNPSPGPDLEHVLDDCRSILQRLTIQLQNHDPLKSKSSTSRIVNRILWPLRKGETEDLIVALQRQKSSLSLTLDTLSTNLLLDQASVLDDLADSIADLSTQVKSHYDIQQRIAVLDWLSEYQHEAQFQRACQLHCDNTCSWLLHHPGFVAWLQTRSSLLWMHGQAGSGKTILSSYVINYLKGQQTASSFLLAYFYYDASTIESLSPETFFGAILKQLCSLLPQLPQSLIAAYERASRRSGTPKQPSLSDLRRSLENVLELQMPCIIVIDGLDESPNYRAVCDFLTSIVESGNHALKVFISSRPEVDLRRRFAKFQEIPVPEDAIQDDIGRYIAYRIEHDVRLRRMSQNMKDYVEHRLRLDCHGMFRWVQCQLDAISRLRTDAALKRALSSLPQSLEGSYSQILQNIDSEDVTFARRTLLWLAHAATPLTLPQLSQAVILEPNFVRIDPDIELNDPNDVLEICGSLVSYNTISRTARIAHHSVREYLTERLTETSEFYIPAQTSHRTIAEACLNYLLLWDFRRGPRSEKELRSTLHSYPLLQYAAQNWPFHVQLSGAEAELQPLILRLMTPEPSPNFFFWLQVVLYDSRHGYLPPSSELLRARPLYYATSYGLTETVRSLISAGASLDERAGRYGGTAIHAAVWRKRPEILRLLLDAGANAMIKDDNEQTAPELSLWNGQLAMFSMFKEPVAKLMRSLLQERANLLPMSDEEKLLLRDFDVMQPHKDNVGEDEPWWVTAKVYEKQPEDTNVGLKEVDGGSDSQDDDLITRVKTTQADFENVRSVAAGQQAELG